MWVVAKEEDEVVVDWAPRRDRGLDSWEDPSSCSYSETVTRIEEQKAARKEDGRVVWECLTEANKSICFLLRHCHEGAYKGRASRSVEERNEVNVDLIDQGTGAKIVSWRWPLDSPDARQLGLCTQKTRTVEVEGTERTFVCHRIGGKCFVYVDLCLVPVPLVRQLEARDLVGEIRTSNLVLLDVVHLDCHGGTAVPAEYDAATKPEHGTSAAGERRQLLEALNEQVRAVVGAIQALRERCGSNHGGKKGGGNFAEARKLQNRLGQLWHQARRLLVE
ncbi:hypothetical protein HOP50_08g51280 [Chloropicon primus]|uniref:Uncharacterized protein n=1 Tax=Chloropicon primus TaxID=1764295 RepID=A0A5B8MRN4_9CHLO|nr:hypothetical protein A3770_08p51020 [Chloropicon primus]UPR01806.1 hypothetical protein HOP50_08g51280 [Chloropicon primus]|eukprot:QDZ22584.1 hypothetical protein A3770_08p51020 [Chloropicon primus]